MFWELIDYKKLADKLADKKIFNRDKIDPRSFSFLEPGWWALHATAITAVYMLGSLMSRKNQHHTQ